MVDMDAVMTLLVPAKVLYNVWLYYFYNMTLSTELQRRHMINIVCKCLKRILTTLLLFFLICLYLSSRALSKAFEHRNFVARYQRETNNTTAAKVA